jgi:hypothetical protein
MRAIALVSLFLVTAVGCSSSDEQLAAASGGLGATGTGGAGAGSGSTGANGTGGSGTGASGTGGGLSLDTGSMDGGGTSGCSGAAQLLYVVGTLGVIYSFDPPTKVFTKIATPGCAGTSTPNSMAIDRNLIAYLNYVPTIYTYDLKLQDGCKPSGITLPSGFEQVGMGFATDGVGGTAETLYLSSISGQGLGKVDMSTKTVVQVGNPPMGSEMGGELTGTGDARLFQLLVDPMRVDELDKSNGATLSNDTLAGFPNPFTPVAYAFSFWGGDFYVYSAPGDNTTYHSSVIHYSPATNTVDMMYVADVGFTISGAGASTCAPLAPLQ